MYNNIDAEVLDFQEYYRVLRVQRKSSLVKKLQFYIIFLIHMIYSIRVTRGRRW